MLEIGVHPFRAQEHRLGAYAIARIGISLQSVDRKNARPSDFGPPIDLGIDLGMIRAVGAGFELRMTNRLALYLQADYAALDLDEGTASFWGVSMGLCAASLPPG